MGLDGGGAISIEAFDAVGNSLGTAAGTHAQGNHLGNNTLDDRFYGAEHSGGISRNFLSNAFGGIEIDHVQFGRVLSVNPPPDSSVPVPGTLPPIGLSLIGLMATRRRLAAQ